MFRPGSLRKPAEAHTSSASIQIEVTPQRTPWPQVFHPQVGEKKHETTVEPIYIIPTPLSYFQEGGPQTSKLHFRVGP